jgi:Rad3-related DNA helicase
MARSRGKRLVVSTSTVTLQHQYADKDAPALQRLLPTGFTFAVAKGRRRYVCTAKLLGAAQVPARSVSTSTVRETTLLPWGPLLIDPTTGAARS